jgi:polyisoprenyl-teichoic acid--peptidoglycan teichoic acid transferase
MLKKVVFMGKKRLKIYIFVAVLAIIGISSYMAIKYYVYGEVYTSRPEILAGSDLDRIMQQHEENIYKPEKEANQRPYSVLLVGLDSKTMDSGRSDTLMVALVDQKNKKVSLLSIPRDTRVQIAGRDLDKITHAHNYGINSTIMTVEDFLDIKIDYYAQINFEGFQSLVNTLGGVTVDVEKNLSFRDRITNTQFSLNKGTQKLNGIQALNYARFRDDWESDFGRNRRQQQVIKALMDETMTIRTITKINPILKDIGEYVETDMDFDVLAKTLTKMKNVSSKDVYSIPMKAYPTTINRISYVTVDHDSLEKVKNYIKDVFDGKNPVKMEE